MENMLFSKEDFSADYTKFCLEYGEPFLKRIMSHLMEKKEKPFELAVDVGCGSGRSTRVLAPYFHKVIGTDISETQIDQARASLSPDNVSYIVCPAESLKLEDSSVDLITAVWAAHWFELDSFIEEVNRVLKPRGCVALLAGKKPIEIHFDGCSDKLTAIIQETWGILDGFLDEKTRHHLYNQYEDFYNAIPYSEKERITNVFLEQKMTIQDVMNVIKATPMHHIYKNQNPLLAEQLIQKTEQRFRDVLKESFDHAVVDLFFPYYLVLACKPNPE